MKKLGAFGILLAAIILMVGIASADTLTIRPNGQGNYAAWTNSGCSSGSSEWQCVDEDPANTGDNLYTNGKNIYETFTFGDTGFTNEIINSVTLYFYGQQYSSTRYQFQPLIRASSTNYLGSLKSLSSSYALYSQVYSTNPATGAAWTISAVNALEAGMKSYSSTYGGRIAQVYAVVDYSHPDSCDDTDGYNITSYGIVSGYYNDAQYSDGDYCVDSGNVQENFCNSTYAQSQQQSCGTDGYFGNSYCMNNDEYRDYTDYACASGACGSDTTQVLQEDCGTSGYLGDNYCTANDVYRNYSTVSCTSGACGSDTTPILQEDCGTSGYVGDDYCLDGDVYRDYEFHTCSAGTCLFNTTAYRQQECYTEWGQYCSDGDCLWSDSCDDSDGGFVPEILGNVTGYLNQDFYGFGDFCVNTSIVEYYCSGSFATYSLLDCANNVTSTCYFGECI